MRPRHDFSNEVRPHRSRLVRGLLVGVGIVFAGLGIAGVVLPLMPGMPFLLIAAACFAHASDRFYNWLLNHPLVGPPLHAWRNHRRIPRRVKPRAVGAVLLAFGLSTWFVLDDVLLQVLWMSLGVCVAILIAGLPSYDESMALDHERPSPEGDREGDTATQRAR
jgi:hypothetical protein